MSKIFQKWPLGGVLGLILLSVSVSTSCMQGKGQGQADAQTETAQVAKEQRSADGLRLMSMCHRRTKEPSPDSGTSLPNTTISQRDLHRR